MTTTIELTDSQLNALHSFARKTGKTEDELVSEAVNKFIDEIENEEKPDLTRHEAIMAAAGIWENRDDLPDFEALRREADRYANWSEESE